MGEANNWLIHEIQAHTSLRRPGFISAMAISCYYTPAWFKDLQEKLPPEYILVGPEDLARLYKQQMRRSK